MSDMKNAVENRPSAIEPPNGLPADLISDFDLYGKAGNANCPFHDAAALHEGPPVVWAPDRRSGGAWVVSRAEDIRFVMSNPQLFSNRQAAGFSKLVGESWDLVPLELDPPEHTKFRTVMNPVLSPSRVKALTPGILERAVELIENVKDQGGCEFMEAFGLPFPVSIFMQLMGLPAEQTETFLTWEYELLHSPDIQVKMTAAKQIRDYLEELSRERRARPTGDLTSHVVTAQVDGRPFTDGEVMGALYLLFVGGLDTVASSLGFFFKHLAEDQEQQAWLRANPDKIEKAVEELLRRYSVVSTRRAVTQDLEFAGVQMKAGDWVSATYSHGSLDPQEFGCPMDTDLQRRGVRHFAFGFGPHFCLGSHLARRELVVALTEWLARVPQWRIRAGSDVLQHGGGVFGVDRLELEW